MQCQEITVSTHNGFGLSRYGKLQKLVIVRVAAGTDLRDRFDNIYAFNEGPKKVFALCRAQVAIEFMRLRLRAASG